MEVTDYKLLSKQENNLGVSLTFKKTSEILAENKVVRDPQTFWEKVLYFFGHRFYEEEHSIDIFVSEAVVFYPKKNGIAFTAEMSYPNGTLVPYALSKRLLALASRAAFEEVPITQSKVR